MKHRIIRVKSVESEGVTSKLIFSHDGEANYITHKVIRPNSYSQKSYMVDGDEDEMIALALAIETAENGCDMRDVIGEFDHILQHVA